MNLREQAEQDLAVTLEDSENGFGVPISVTDPAGLTAELIGQSGDIHFLIDPDTGQAVSGRVAHVSLRISTLIDAGFDIPKAINNKTEKPWIFIFEENTFTVQESRPDRTLGIVTILLETYVNNID